MKEFNVYEDIVKRTNGDIYLGVVGPVRCGKSTFIRKFMEKFVLPKIEDNNVKARAVDELPQSADGKTIMTTQPKFVPNEAVKIMVGDKIGMNIRLIDCVGLMVDGAIGDEEDGKPRMVKTPWSKEEMTFAQAGKIGTMKVVNEHSTIAVLMTTDGTIGELDRESYVKAESEVANELIKSGKPFVVVINTTNVNGERAQKLKTELEEKYKAPACVVDVMNISGGDVEEIFSGVLMQFPLTSVKVRLPKWLNALPFENEFIQEIVQEMTSAVEDAQKIGDFASDKILFLESENFEPLVINNLDMGTGKIVFEVEPKSPLFYKVVSNECKLNISDDFELIESLKGLSEAKAHYDKLKNALVEVEENGYGVVTPTLDDMSVYEPELIKGGARSGIKFKATAPSLHIMRVDVTTERSLTVGSEIQSQELVNDLKGKYNENKNSILATNIFGKTLKDMIETGIYEKVASMPVDVKKKMRKALGRVVNEGKGGIICILL